MGNFLQSIKQTFFPSASLLDVSKNLFNNTLCDVCTPRRHEGIPCCLTASIICVLQIIILLNEGRRSSKKKSFPFFFLVFFNVYVIL
jgi:hypothetical protein